MEGAPALGSKRRDGRALTEPTLSSRNLLPIRDRLMVSIDIADVFFFDALGRSRQLDS